MGTVLCEEGCLSLLLEDSLFWAVCRAGPESSLGNCRPAAFIMTCIMGTQWKLDENLATASKCFPSIFSDNVIILIWVVHCSSTPDLQKEYHNAPQHSYALLLPISHQCPTKHLLMGLLWFKFGRGPLLLPLISNNPCLWERNQIHLMWEKQSIWC